LGRLTGLLFSVAFASIASAQPLEKTSVRLGVGNKSHLYYLPLTLAERRGHFKEYGLDVSITDFEGGGESLDALMGGLVDVVTGAYEHILRMQAKGHNVRAVIELGRFPASPCCSWIAPTGRPRTEGNEDRRPR
jgi:NitT/TauT family transport system substrate-binding protein